MHLYEQRTNHESKRRVEWRGEIEVLRADEGEMRREWSSAGMPTRRRPAQFPLTKIRYGIRKGIEPALSGTFSSQWNPFSPPNSSSSSIGVLSNSDKEKLGSFIRAYTDEIECRGTWEYPEKTNRRTGKSATFSMYGNPRLTPPGMLRQPNHRGFNLLAIRSGGVAADGPSQFFVLADTLLSDFLDTIKLRLTVDEETPIYRKRFFKFTLRAVLPRIQSGGGGRQSASLPPTRTGFDYQQGRSRIIVRGTRASRTMPLVEGFSRGSRRSTAHRIPFLRAAQTPLHLNILNRKLSTATSHPSTKIRCRVIIELLLHICNGGYKGRLKSLNCTRKKYIWRTSSTAMEYFNIYSVRQECYISGKKKWECLASLQYEVHDFPKQLLRTGQGKTSLRVAVVVVVVGEGAFGRLRGNLAANWEKAAGSKRWRTYFFYKARILSARPRSRSEGAIRATLTRTPSASSLLRAQRAVFSSRCSAVQIRSVDFKSGHFIVNRLGRYRSHRKASTAEALRAQVQRLARSSVRIIVRVLYRCASKHENESLGTTHFP
ncbi:hypothetical protein PR048_028713 [Dryococelus australis]|uniref:Ribosomal protein S3 n=1 Tax=Dryococelus australis TaxID=614101 RepID=A0ABQ9GBT7_9NEOP|nr:hypothetical protein PR048_028713 [Dryococelus australis]